MKQYSATTKHHILLEYIPRSPNYSFTALATRHHINGGAETIRKWHQRWNGTIESLKRKSVTGRPRVLSKAQVRRHIATPIRNANRAHRPTPYTKLLTQVQRVTHKDVSLRSVQRYGKNELGARSVHGKKRTAEESEYSNAWHDCVRCVIVE